MARMRVGRCILEVGGGWEVNVVGVFAYRSWTGQWGVLFAWSWRSAIRTRRLGSSCVFDIVV